MPATKRMQATKRRTPARKPTARKTAARRTRGGRKYWSAEVTQKSDALDLEQGVFAGHDPKRIAESLKRSAERSRRRNVSKSSHA